VSLGNKREKPMAVSYENLPGADSAPKPHPNVRDLRVAGPLDATLPPTPIRELLAASGATLYVLATDASFVATIRRAAEQHPLFVVETWPELREAVESGQCGIALIDAAVLGPRVANCVATLATFHDRLVTLVAADRASAHEYIGLLSGGRIHRLLIKPTAVGAARLLIESATARRLQLREEATKAVAPSAVSAGANRTNWIWGAGVAAIALLAVAIIGGRADWWSPATATTNAETAASADAEAAAPPVTTPSPEQLLADLRARAALALQEGRLAEPPGDNALEHFLSAVALVPADQAARAGLASVVDGLFTRAEAAFLADSLESAAEALDHVRRVDPASSRLAFLDAQLARALAVVAAPPPVPARTAVPPTPAAPTELDSIVSLATARLARGQILTPVGDSAVAYLDRAMQIGPNDARVARLRVDATTALIAAARVVLDTDVATAASLTAEARRVGIDSAALVALEADVGAAVARERQRQLSARLDAARDSVRSGALFAPANANALVYLTALQADAPELAGLAEEWEAFRQAAVLAIESSIASSDWATADAQLAGLAQAPAGAITAQPLAAELAARRQQESYLATPAQASAMTLQTAAQPVYPPRLLERAVEGWVDLEYVVDRNGVPRDIVVTQASPPERFDAAAVEAVQQYRYLPFERDGRIYERRLKMRMRFEVQ
jgi:TonB family protein